MLIGTICKLKLKTGEICKPAAGIIYNFLIYRFLTHFQKQAVATLRTEPTGLWQGRFTRSELGTTV